MWVLCLANGVFGYGLISKVLSSKSPSAALCSVCALERTYSTVLGQQYLQPIRI
jgi:hypothetical protein